MAKLVIPRDQGKKCKPNKICRKETIVIKVEVNETETKKKNRTDQRN